MHQVNALGLCTDQRNSNNLVIRARIGCGRGRGWGRLNHHDWLLLYLAATAISICCLTCFSRLFKPSIEQLSFVVSCELLADSLFTTIVPTSLGYLCVPGAIVPIQII